MGKGHTITKLFKDAIPSKNLPQEESKRKPDVEIKVKIEEDQTKVEENLKDFQCTVPDCEQSTMSLHGRLPTQKDFRQQRQCKKQSYFCQKDALSEIEIKDELLESVDIQDIEEEQEKILGF